MNVAHLSWCHVGRVEFILMVLVSNKTVQFELSHGFSKITWKKCQNCLIPNIISGSVLMRAGESEHFLWWMAHNITALQGRGLRIDARFCICRIRFDLGDTSFSFSNSVFNLF